MNRNRKLPLLAIAVLVIGALVYFSQRDTEPRATSPVTMPVFTQPAVTESRPTTTAARPNSTTTEADVVPSTTEADVIFGEWYTSDEDVALYLELFEELPPNYLTKDEAYDRGWVPQDGNLWEIAPGHSIGGDRFGNREGLLPEARGRQYYEADVNYDGGRRGAERLVFSDDGLIFYTGDHYNSFEKLFD